MSNSSKDPRLRDPRVMRLALKYAYIWKTRCEALRAKTHCVTGDRCSVHHVVVRAFDGRIEVLRREKLPRLKAGTEPFGDARVKARLRDLPPQLPPDLYYVPLDISTYLGTDAPDFAALLFTAPTRVYLMLPSLMREPRWLRDLFVKLRDPASGNHVSLPCSWHLGSGFRLVLAAGMLHQAFVRQRLMVWESIKVYGVDEELVLGGPGLAEMGDTLFVIATRSLQALQPLAGSQPLPSLQPQRQAHSALSSPPLSAFQSPVLLAGGVPSFPPQTAPPLHHLVRRGSRFAADNDGSLGSGSAAAAAAAASATAAAATALAPGAPAAGGSNGGLVSASSVAPPECGSPVRPSDCRLQPLEVADGGGNAAGALPGAWRTSATGMATAAAADLEPCARVSRPSLFYRRPGEEGAGGGALLSGAGGSGVVGGAGGGAAWLLQRFHKVVKRDRLQDLRALLESDPWQRYCMTADEVSFLPPSERWPLTVDLAVANVNVPVLVELVDRAGCHLNYRAAKLLVAHWDRLPEHCAGGGEGLLLRYLARKPNPLSVLGACLLAMRAELASGRNHSMALQGAVSRFKVLQTELLSQVQDSYFKISEEARLEAGLPLLEDILEQPQAMLSGAAAASSGTGGGGLAGAAAPPPLQPLVLSDYSPLRLAFRDHDTQFMSAQLIEGYTRRRWLGPEFAALTSLDGHNRLSGLDPMFVYTITENLGFVGEAGSASMAATMRLWHLVTMTSPAFFRSPRGRWAMKFMSTFAFLALYMVVLSSYKEVRLPASRGGGVWRALHTFFLMFTAGNVLEGVEVLAMRYRNSAGRYFSSAPGEVLGVLVDVGIFASVMPCLVAAYVDMAAGGGGGGGTAGAGTDWGGGGGDPYSMVAAAGGGSSSSSYLNAAQWTMLRLSLSTLAIFVWMRSLLIMVPLYRKLGPMIRTMTRMAGEILAFVPLYVSVTLGFAAALHSAIGDGVPEYRTFVAAVLHLFEATLGTFDYDIFDGLDERQRLYGQVLTTVYLVLAAIMLTNLLIAIITYKYRPEEVRAESVFDLAEMVDRYRFQVKHHLICSPFNLVVLLFAWMPAAPMPKLPPYEWVKYGFTPLDGLTFATPRFPTTPGGRHEIPHLCYLLTLYPVIILVSNVLYYLHAPYAVLYWALIGHRKLLRELLGDRSSKAKANGAATAGAAAAAGRGGAVAQKTLNGAMFTPVAAGAKANPSTGFGGGGGGAGRGGGGSPGLGNTRFSFEARPPEHGAAGGPHSYSSHGAAQPRGGRAHSHTGMQSSSKLGSPAKTHTLLYPPPQPPQPKQQQQQPPGSYVPRRADSRPGTESALLEPREEDPGGGARGPSGSGSGGGNALRRVPSGAASAGAPSVWVRTGSGRWHASATSIPDGSAPSTSDGTAERALSALQQPHHAQGAQQQGGQGGQGAPARWQPGPVAEKLERAPVGVAGTDVEAMRMSPKAPREAAASGGGGGGGGGFDGLRAKSLRSMQSYLNSFDPGTGSGRNLSGRVDELSLYDDVSDGVAVQPPYMALLRLATLSGLASALVSALRFALLLLAGTLLYVFLMGLLAGTLGCCMTTWVGSVGVSVYRIVAGAWVGARSGGEAAAPGGGGGGGGAGEAQDAAACSAKYAPAEPAGGAAAPVKPNATRWVSLARKARSRATRSTYLTRAQVESAIRHVYTASSVLSAWGAAGQPSAASAFGRGGAHIGSVTAAGGAGAGGGASDWAAAADKLGLRAFAAGGGEGGDAGGVSAARPAVAPPTHRLAGGQPDVPSQAPLAAPPDMEPEVLDLAELDRMATAGGGGGGLGGPRRWSRSRLLAAGPAAPPEPHCGLLNAVFGAAAAAAATPGFPRRAITEPCQRSCRRASSLAGAGAPGGDAGGAEDGASASLPHLPVPVPRMLSLSARGPKRVFSGDSRMAAGRPPAAFATLDDDRLLAALRVAHDTEPAAPPPSHAGSAAAGVGGPSSPGDGIGAWNIPGSIASVSGQPRQADTKPVTTAIAAAGERGFRGAAAAAAAAAAPGVGAEAGTAGLAAADQLSAMRDQVASLTATVQQLASMVGTKSSVGYGPAALDGKAGDGFLR